MDAIIEVPTLSELAYQSIKDQILSCKIRPGEKINIDKYAVTLGISATPIREALSKLQQEGLVQYVPRTGWKISKISQHEFQDLREVKALMEITISLRALPYIKSKDIPKLVLLNNQMRDIVTEAKDGKPDLEKLLIANDRFHMYIFNFCPNDIMKGILQQSWNNLKYARLVWISSNEFLMHFYEEHNEIIRAIKNQDADALRKAVENHLQCGIGKMETYLDSK